MDSSTIGLEIEIYKKVLQEETRKNIIQKYVECRKKQKLTQAELAERAGISRTNISRFESGTYNPSLETLVKVALALGMSLDVSLDEINDR